MISGVTELCFECERCRWLRKWYHGFIDGECHISTSCAIGITQPDGFCVDFEEVIDGNL